MGIPKGLVTESQRVMVMVLVRVLESVTVRGLLTAPERARMMALR